MVKPKKHLGQHFLTNVGVAEKIAQSLTNHNQYKILLEIGPGTGALTKHLIPLSHLDLWLSEIDEESVVYLKENYPQLADQIFSHDFLKFQLSDQFQEPIGIIGNFPYNISSQILFRVFEQKEQVQEVVGMFQKEVAQRIASGPGTKDYGILSVLLQAFYDIEYLFTVNEGSFNPPPKVKSGVIRLRRNTIKNLQCELHHFTNVVKTTFNQRRKTIRNSSKGLCSPTSKTTDPLFDRRPETLTVADFETLTMLIFNA